MFKVVPEVQMKMWLALLLTYRSLPLYHPLSLPDKLVPFTICYPKCIKHYLSCWPFRNGMDEGNITFKNFNFWPIFVCVWDPARTKRVTNRQKETRGCVCVLSSFSISSSVMQCYVGLTLKHHPLLISAALSAGCPLSLPLPFIHFLSSTPQQPQTQRITYIKKKMCKKFFLCFFVFYFCLCSLHARPYRYLAVNAGLYLLLNKRSNGWQLCFLLLKNSLLLWKMSERLFEPSQNFFLCTKWTKFYFNSYCIVAATRHIIHTIKTHKK